MQAPRLTSKFGFAAWESTPLDYSEGSRMYGNLKKVNHLTVPKMALEDHPMGKGNLVASIGANILQKPGAPILYELHFAFIGLQGRIGTCAVFHHHPIAHRRLPFDNGGRNDRELLNIELSSRVRKLERLIRHSLKCPAQLPCTKIGKTPPVRKIFELALSSTKLFTTSSGASPL